MHRKQSYRIAYFGAEAQREHHHEEKYAEDGCRCAHQTNALWVDDKGKLRTLSSHLHERVHTLGDVHVSKDSKYSKACVEACQTIQYWNEQHVPLRLNFMNMKMNFFFIIYANWDNCFVRHFYLRMLLLNGLKLAMLIKPPEQVDKA